MRARLKLVSHGGTPAPPPSPWQPAPSALGAATQTEPHTKTPHPGPREGRFYLGVLGELYGGHRPHTPHHCTIARCIVLMSNMSSCAMSVHVLRCLRRHDTQSTDMSEVLRTTGDIVWLGVML